MKSWSSLRSLETPRYLPAKDRPNVQPSRLSSQAAKPRDPHFIHTLFAIFSPLKAGISFESVSTTCYDTTDEPLERTEYGAPLLFAGKPTIGFAADQALAGV